MKLQSGVYVVTTQTSSYLIDTLRLSAVRAPRARMAGAGPEGADVSVHRALFTDRAPLVLTEVPEPAVGHRMRLRILVAEEFLDHASKARPTDLVTSEVISVTPAPEVS